MGCGDNPTRFFVHESIDWERVRYRLDYYPAIRRAFPETMLLNDFDNPPYYCHYMAWRLGTWHTDSHFANLEHLLCHAEQLPNWKHETSLLTNGEYATYWSLVWQLQVATYLSKVGEDVHWSDASGGPDLSVLVNARRWFVECYCIRKSYGLLEFLQECLSKVLGISVQTDYQHFSQMSLPQGKQAVGPFLDQHLRPFCGSTHRDRAVDSYVEVVYDGPGEVRVVVESWSDEGELSNLAAGSPQQHVATMLSEALKAKAGKNQLCESRPNILAVNLLLTDAPVAEILRPDVGTRVAPDLSETSIDVLAASSITGIDSPKARLSLAAVRTAELRDSTRWLE